jgi:hypothetical protein
MPVYSHLHQLFNVNTCHAYIHTLRWKDRPLQCPRCQSQDAGRKGQAKQGGKNLWDVGYVVVARSASRAGAITTKIDRRLSRGSAARAPSSCKPSGISRSARCRKPPTSPSTRGVSSTRTRPAAIGHCKAIGTRS